jgi:predicted phage terminase large subunit-like protein
MDSTIDKKATLLKKLKDSIELFGKVCFPDAYKRDTPPFHTEIYRAIQDPTKERVLIAAPRGSAKSTIVSFVVPMYKIAFKKRGENVFVVIISESSAQSANFLSTIKTTLNEEPIFRALFGDLGERTAKRWRENDIILANGARILAMGTGQKIRGQKETHTRPTTLIMDDIESETNAYTKEARLKNRHWITEAVLPSLDDNAQIIMIGTVISEDCFLYWAKDSSVWYVLWYSIIDENGKSIWPDKFPLSRIEKRKQEYAEAGNINGFFQEYMNQAQSPEEAPFQPSFIKNHPYELRRDENLEPYLFKDWDLKEGEEPIVIPIDIYQGVDPASSLSQKADFFVIVTIGVDAKKNYYLLDVYRKRVSPAQQPQLILDKYLEFKPRRVKIETVAYQEALRDGVRALMAEKGVYIPGLEAGVKPRNPKSERLLSLVPLFASGRFFFRPQDIEAQGEFLSYPKGKHDDVMDGIWTAIQETYPCQRTVAQKDANTKIKKEEIKKLDWHIL